MANPAFRVRATCPACGAADFRVIGTWPYAEPPVSDYLATFYHDWRSDQARRVAGADYELAVCPTCRLVFQVQVPGDELAQEIQDVWIDPELEEARITSDGALAYHAQHAQDLMQTLSILADGRRAPRVMDFGMGWGHWASMARAFGCDVFGCELSQRCVDRGRALGIHMVGWDDIPGLALDYVNTENVFEHLTEPLETLRQLRLGLGDTGLIRIRVPAARDMGRRLERMDWDAAKGDPDSLNPVAPLEHINCYAHESLRQMASRAGLRLKSLPARAHYAHLVDWSTPRKIVKNLVLPLYRDLLRRQNDVLLEPAGDM